MSDYTDEEIQTVQGVLDRVSSYQDGAPEGTVLAELRKGFDEAGIEVEADDLQKLADAIDEDAGEVSAADVLG